MWYYRQNDSNSGPVTEAEIRRLLAAGQLTGDSYVWTEGMPQWAMLRNTALAAGTNLPPPTIDPRLTNPYWTEHAGGQAMGYGAAGQRLPGAVYRNPAGLARWVTIFFIGLMLANVAAIVLYAQYYQWAQDIQKNIVPHEDIIARGERLDHLNAIYSLVQFPVYGAIIILYYMWVYRTNQNAHSFGANGLEFTPGWAVGWNFIPIANLWKPFHALSETWRASQDPANYQSLPLPLPIRLWWTAFIIQMILAVIFGGLGGYWGAKAAAMNQPELYLTYPEYWLVVIIGTTVQLPILFLQLRVVRSLTAIQVARDETGNTAENPYTYKSPGA